MTEYYINTIDNFDNREIFKGYDTTEEAFKASRRLKSKGYTILGILEEK